MERRTMNRKTFLKWLGAVLVGLCSGRSLQDTASSFSGKRPIKEARHYRSGRRLAG